MIQFERRFLLGVPRIILLSAMVFAGVAGARADRTYVWAGQDSRFRGWFSISENDFEKRSFDTITAARFEFLDPQNPSLSAVLEDPRGFYSQNTSGRLTPSGERLSHEPHPENPNVSFWVAVWQFPGIDVGMYGHNSGESHELFTYANHPANFVVDAQGQWELSPVPEPSSLALVVLAGGLVSLTCRILRRLK